MDFRKLVLDKIDSVGTKDAAKFFGVSAGTISNWHSGKTSPSIAALQLVWGDNGAEAPAPKPELVNWEGRKVVLLQPVYRSFNPMTHFTLFANYARYGPDKIAMEYKTRTVIHESRNILIDKAMKIDGVEDILMVDDDMVLPCGMPNKFNTTFRAKLPADLASQVAFSRILSHDAEKGIVGCLYFGRSQIGHAQCASGFASKYENSQLHGLAYRGLRAEDWVATGFIRIKRWVIEKMKAAIDAGKWPECKPSHEDSWYGYFNPLRVRVGEDVSFGRRAAEIGIQSYVDTSLVCGHADGNYIYWHYNTNGE